jgi:hypothetical protein
MAIDEAYDTEVNHEFHANRAPSMSLIWRHQQDEIEVDVETEEITRHSIMSNTLGSSTPIGYSGPIGYHLPGYTYQTTYNGVMYVRLVMKCRNCARYHYMLQILVDLTQLRIADVLLNSEHMTLMDDDHMLHHITNVYPSEKTEYHYNRPPSGSADINDSELIKLPIMAMDVERPYKMLERVKNLLVFL